MRAIAARSVCGKMQRRPALAIQKRGRVQRASGVKCLAAVSGAKGVTVRRGAARAGDPGSANLPIGGVIGGPKGAILENGVPRTRRDATASCANRRCEPPGLRRIDARKARRVPRGGPLRLSALDGGDTNRAADRGGDVHDGGELHAAFGATRVGALLDRLRLHLRTDRFLAERRRDAVWDASCDYASLALTRIASRMSPSMLAERVIPCAAAGSR
jgi:hypothetical protein